MTTMSLYVLMMMQDTCDDCSTGTYNTSDDGFDYDTDGLCDAGDQMMITIMH